MGDNYRILWAFRIAGVNDSVSAAAGGVWFYKGKWNPPTITGHVWIDGLIQAPEPAVEIDKIMGEFRSGPVVFKLSASDRIAKLIEFQSYDDVGRLDLDLNLTATLMQLEGLLLLSTGLYWIGDEVVRVTGSSGGFNVITRAQCGTVAGYHDAGDPVTVGPVVWDGLGCTLAIVDVFGDLAGTAGAIIPVWQGFLEDIDDGLDSYMVRAVGDWTYFRAVESNKNPRDWSRSGAFFRSGGVTWGTVDRPAINDNSGVLVRSIAVNGYAAHLNNAVVFGNLIGDQVFFKAQPGAIRSGTGDLYQPVRFNTMQYMDTDDSIETVAFDGPVHEIAVIDRIGDRTAGIRKISCTQALEKPYHPLSICLALLVSDGTADISNYKIFQAQFGLGLVNVDITQWKAVLAATPEFDEGIDQWVGGWGGQKVRVIEEVQKILRVFGFMAVVDGDTFTRVRRIEELNLELAKAAFDNAVRAFRDSSFGRKRGIRERAGRVNAVVGGLPWLAGVSVEIETGAARRRAQIVDNVRDMDLSVVRRADALWAAEKLSTNALLAYFAVPELVVRVPNRVGLGGPEYKLLDYVALSSIPIESAWWVDKERIRRADVSGVIELFGQIIGIKLLDSLAYELRLSFTAFRSGRYARERAPALYVRSDAGAVMTVENIGMGLPGDFEPDEEVEFWTMSGELVPGAGLRTVVSTTATTVTLNSAPTGGATCYVMRAARSKLFDSPKYDPFDTQRFVFGAAANGDLERASGTVPGDIYGARLGLSSGGGFDPWKDFTVLFSYPTADDPVLRNYQYVDAESVDIDGTSGSPPVDMFLMWRLLRNMARLASVGSHVHKRELAPAISTLSKGGDVQRFYASLDEFTIWSIPWLCQKGLQEIRTRAIVLVSRPDAMNVGSMSMRAELVGIRDFRFGIPATFDGVEDTWEATDWNLTFDPLNAEFVTDLNLWGKSANYSATLSTLSSPAFTAGNKLTAALVGSAAIANNQDPVNASSPCSFVYLETAGNTLFDTLGMRVDTSIYVRPVGGVAPGPIGSTTARGVSFLQSKGFDLSEVFDPGAWVPARSTFKAADTVHASDDGALPISRRILDKRRRCVWVGPTGRTVVPERGMPPNHHERFERVRGIDATWRHWFVADVTVDHDVSDFVCLFNFIPILVSGQIRTNGSFSGLQELATLADWEIRAVVEDWNGVVAASAAVEMDVEHYPTDVTANAFLFLQAEDNRFANAVWNFPAETFNSGSLHSMKEGRLSRADMQLIHRGRIRLPVSEYSIVGGADAVGVRIRFEARIKPASVLYQQGLSADINSKLSGALHLVCTGASIWEGRAYEGEIET